MFWYWKQTAVGNLKTGLDLESYKLVLPARSELEQTGLGTGSVCYSQQFGKIPFIHLHPRFRSSFNLIILMSMPVPVPQVKAESGTLLT